MDDTVKLAHASPEDLSRLFESINWRNVTSLSEGFASMGTSKSEVLGTMAVISAQGIYQSASTVEEQMEVFAAVVQLMYLFLDHYQSENPRGANALQ